MIGDLFGQRSSSDGLSPGRKPRLGRWRGTVYRAVAQPGQLVIDAGNARRALFNQTKQFQLDANVEPFMGLKIELHGLFEDNRRTEFQYRIGGATNKTANGPTNGIVNGITGGIPKTLGGSFAISTVSLASLFDGSNAANNYRSHAFERFLSNRETIAARVQEQYNTESQAAGLPHPIAQANASSRSADVLIPAFLSAYRKGCPHHPAYSFPKARALMPNWNLSYDLLTMIPILRDYLRSLDLMHGYTSRFKSAHRRSRAGFHCVREQAGLRQ